MSKYRDEEVMVVIHPLGFKQWRTVDRIEEVDGVLRKIPVLKANETIKWIEGQDEPQLKR